MVIQVYIYKWSRSSTFGAASAPAKKARHATTLPQQRDHVFRPQICWILQYYTWSSITLSLSRSYKFVACPVLLIWLPGVMELVVQFPQVVAVGVDIEILHGDGRYVQHVQFVGQLPRKLGLLQCLRTKRETYVTFKITTGGYWYHHKHHGKDLSPLSHLLFTGLNDRRLNFNSVSKNLRCTTLRQLI